MADIVTIGAFLTSVKNATEIAKAIRNVDVSLEKAETKLKMADLIESLADARIQAAEIGDVLQAKDQKIAELEHALELKATLVRKHDAYYETDPSGNATGPPYCSHCWEVNHKAIHMVTAKYQHRECPACKVSVVWQLAPLLEQYGRRHITNRWTGATGSDFRIIIGPAQLLGNAVARSTPPLCRFDCR